MGKAGDRWRLSFDKGGSTPGRKHKFGPGDGCWFWAEDWDGNRYKQAAYVTDWEVKNDGRGHYQVIRMSGRHRGARPYGRPIWIISYKLEPTGNWWHGLLVQFRANTRLRVEDGDCSCHCCVHQPIPRSHLNWDGTVKGEDDDIESDQT